MGRTRKHTRRRPRPNPHGVLVVHAGSFGFVRTAEGEYFIPESKMAGAFDGDLVEVAPLPARGASDGARADRPAARVLRVIDRSHDIVVGRYEVAEPFGVVVPEDHNIPYDIFTMRADSPDIPDGALVRVRMTAYPSRHEAACGVIEEVLGMADDATVSVESIIARAKLETVFSEGALAQADAAVLDEVGALAAGYRDIRDRMVFTIDPADARDFDDALSLEPAEDFRKHGAVWRLGVHIADVSHYVEWNSSLDLDARRRAASVYLVDRVIPMLPEQLSNGLCSLNPGETRRCMTCGVYLDEDWRPVGYDLDVYKRQPWYSDSGMRETAFPVDSESVKTTKGQAMTELEQRACDMRIDIVRMIAEAGSGHPGGSLSCTDILTALYFGGVMDHDPEQPKWEDRDRFVLAKGHAAPALYAALAHAGYFPREELKTLRKLGTRLQGHPDCNLCPGVEVRCV